MEFEDQNKYFKSLGTKILSLKEYSQGKRDLAVAWWDISTGLTSPPSTFHHVLRPN